MYAVQKGAFVAAAMGNDGDGGSIEYPAGYSSIQGLMAVGAVGKSKARAYYSSTGGHLEVVAPGGSDQDGATADDAGVVWQVTLRRGDQDPFVSPRPRFDRYVEAGYMGTSMATPHVVALGALLMSQGVTDPRAVEAIIKATALDLGPVGRDAQYGYGLIQARAALFGLGIAR